MTIPFLKKKENPDKDLSLLFFEANSESNRKNKKNNKGIKEIQSTQSFSPIADIKDGIIITKNYDYVVIIEVAPINFNLMSELDQDAVISQFEAALRVLPRDVQFKITNRKMDVNKRLLKMFEQMEKEEDPSCRKMQEEQMELVYETSIAQGISRKFYVIFKHENEQTGFQNLTKKVTWEEIKNQLYRRVEMFSRQLQGCGNFIKTNTFDDENVLRTLYDILHPFDEDDEMYKDIESRMQTAADNHIGATGAYISPNDILAYNNVDTTSPDYILADNTYYAFAYIPSRSYASVVTAGWINGLLGLGRGIDVDVFLNKANKAQARQKLQYAIRLNVMSDKETDSSSTEKDEIHKRLESGYYLKEKLSNEYDEFCYISTFVTITASNLYDLKDRCTKIKRHCKGMDINIRFCKFEQEAAFKSLLPPLCSLNKNLFKKSRRNLMMSDAVSAYPFVSFELEDPDGIMYGTNMMNNSLVIVDNFRSERYSNGNMTICGQSGAGKTYTLSCLCLRMREQGDQVFIIAPEKGYEFRPACEGIGGQYIRVWPGSNSNINVLEIRKHDNEAAKLMNDGYEESQLIQKIQSMHTFFSLLLPNITEEEIQLLDQALIATYKKFGITEDNNSLIDLRNPGTYKEMPLLGDLYEELANEGPRADRLHTILSRFVTGSAKSFNAHTNVDLDNKYIVLDVSRAPKDLMPLCMFIATDFVWDKCQEDRTVKKVIALDEVWKLIGASASPEVAGFVLNIFKLIRGYGGIGIASTQDISDFFSSSNGGFGKAIINASEIKCVLKLKPNEAEFTRSSLNLTDEDVDYVTKKFNRGDMLLMAGNNNVFVHVKANKTEHELITTDPNDIRRQTAEKLAKMHAAQESN